MEIYIIFLETQLSDPLLLVRSQSIVLLVKEFHPNVACIDTLASILTF